MFKRPRVCVKPEKGFRLSSDNTSSYISILGIFKFFDLHPRLRSSRANCKPHPMVTVPAREKNRQNFTSLADHAFIKECEGAAAAIAIAAWDFGIFRRQRSFAVEARTFPDLSSETWEVRRVGGNSESSASWNETRWRWTRTRRENEPRSVFCVCFFCVRLTALAPSWDK